jgi:nucleotide-binding universal stress UspA family protein
MFNRILVAIDGSSTSNHGLDVALGVAKDQQAELTALHVVDEMLVARGITGAEYGAPDYFDVMLDDLRKAGRKVLAKAETKAAKSGQSVQTVLVETLGQSVAHAILAQARKLHADLIVMGTHGRRGLSRLVMGSDAEGVLREARVPVLLVRSPAAPHASRRAPRPRPARRAPVTPRARPQAAHT